MSYYKARECYIHRKIADDEFLVPVGEQALKNNGIVMLNETAAFLHDKLKSKQTIAELCEALMQSYDIDRESAEKDVSEFLDFLLSIEAAEEI